MKMRTGSCWSLGLRSPLVLHWFLVCCWRFLKLVLIVSLINYKKCIENKSSEFLMTTMELEEIMKGYYTNEVTEI